ncbi:hypothetical protein HYDPIDRAFT_162488 [Hydnomerulius pinastri MD-312]|uniref:Uncharacterized protein n=1 Tax=Hydnomerulius pinastri MD-312 TaxID=994086 RepID=A0A0C9W962_9AGAM|nr:hypothetical protein HYDPIDRAFT_162488 [Hydnomerulius pinastri MD-312]
MMPLKPRLRLDSSALPPSSYVQAAGFESRPASSHSHVSSFRSLLLDMQVYSPSVKMVKQPGTENTVSRPVFGDHDKVEGKVMLDPSCSQSGRLTISIEGAFEYSTVKDDVDDDYPCSPTVGNHRHVFLSSSAIIHISPTPDPRSTIREAFGVRKRPSASSLNSPACRSCEFSFEIPSGSRPGEEMPPTFSSTTLVKNRQRRRSYMEKAEVAYRVTATWEASDGSENQAILEAPISFQPDVDFQSLDGSSIEPESWLEMPLKSERPIPFHCAVTLPRPQTFSRCSSIPYFVVFTTTPRSSCLTKEIAADATIAISLIRKVTINPQGPQLPPTPPETPPPSDESDSPFSPATPRHRLLKRRVAKLTTPSLTVVRTPRTPEEPFAAAVKYKPLPELPQESFSETRTLETQICIGFPKRPRTQKNLQAQHNLPDGLYKGKLQLSKDMLPGVDWPGVSVKYYLDVSVLFGQDAVRARVPIRVI